MGEDDSLSPVLHKAILLALLAVIHLDQMCWHFQHKITFQTLRALSSSRGKVTHQWSMHIQAEGTLGEVPHFQQQQRITF